MALLPLPKVPKVSDLLPQLADFDDRISALEGYVTRNDARISALEAYYNQVVADRAVRISELEADVAKHQAGAVERQREVNRLKREASRMRWRMRRKRI